LVASALLLAVIHRGKTFVSELGSRSLYVYLLHGCLIKFYDALDVDDKFAGPTLYIVRTIAALGLTCCLSSRWGHTLVRPLAPPKMDWIFHKQEQRKLNKAAY